MRVPIGITSNATVANRKGIFRVIAPKTHATINHVPIRGGRLRPTITMNKKNLYRQLAPLQTTELHKNAPTKYWALWPIKTKRLKMSLSKSSEMEGIFRTPEPDGLGEGFTL